MSFARGHLIEAAKKVIEDLYSLPAAPESRAQQVAYLLGDDGKGRRRLNRFNSPLAYQQV